MKYSIVITGCLTLLVGCSTMDSGTTSTVEKPGIPKMGKLPKAEAVYGATNPSPDAQAKDPVKRYASIVELDPAKEKEYRELHADVWKEVHAAIKKANIQNYSIYTTDIGGKRYIISYLEYTGTDPDKDFGSIGEDDVTREKWWPATDACQIRIPGTPEGQQWKSMEMLMHVK